MTPLGFTVQGIVRRYPGPGGWHFVQVGEIESRMIREFGDAKKVGWGYVKVRARIGEAAWDTTLFPTKEGRYFLALKAEVRRKHMIRDGGDVRVECVLV